MEVAGIWADQAEDLEAAIEAGRDRQRRSADELE